MERYYFLGARTGAGGGNAAVCDGGGGTGLGIDSDEEDEGVRRATQSERGPVKTLPRRHLVVPRTRMGATALATAGCGTTAHHPRLLGVVLCGCPIHADVRSSDDS